MKKNFSALGEMWTILKFVGGFLWKADKRSLTFAIILNTIDGAILIPSVFIDKQFLDTLISNLQTPDPNKAFRAVMILVTARLFLNLLQSLIKKMSGYYSRLVHINRIRLAEVSVGVKYAKVGVPTIEDIEFKDRYQRIQTEGFGRLQQITDNFLLLPRSISGMFSSLSIFFLGQPIFALISLASLLPSILVDRKFIKKGYEIESKMTKIHRVRGTYSRQLSSPRSYMELRLLNIHEYIGAKISSFWETILKTRSVFFRESRTWGYIAGTLDDFVSFSFTAYLAFQAILGRITIGTTQAYGRAIVSFKSNTMSLTSDLLNLYECQLYISDLVWFFDLPEPYATNSGVKIPDNTPINIELKDVWFKYPESKNWILKGINMEISKKQNIAIVGKNGAGKTTLIKLLCGFYKPNKGTITINGTDISELNKTSYWSKLSVLFQDFDLYTTSIRESIGVSNISKIANSGLIQRYARLCGIEEWISTLPKKYDNPLSRDFEHGVNPSSGQSQRLGLARTLFKDPEILVLDEPTSNVDPEAEEQIFNKILEVGKEKIIVFISHRFSTVRKADRIFVVDEGTVIEQGNHEVLMKQKGEYAKLFTLQAKSYK